MVYVHVCNRERERELQSETERVLLTVRESCELNVSVELMVAIEWAFFQSYTGLPGPTGCSETT